MSKPVVTSYRAEDPGAIRRPTKIEFTYSD
jgi:hypothetical protein